MKYAPRLWHIAPLAFVVLLGVSAFVFVIPRVQKSKKVAETPPAPKVYTDDYYNSLTWVEATSTIPWENRDSSESYIWNDRLYMFGGLDGDGTWDAQGMPQYDKAKYFNDIWVTDNGTDWQLVTEHADLPKLISMSIVPFKGTLYLYAGWGPDIGFNTKIYESIDGVNWSVATDTVPYPEREGQRVLEYNSKLYMFGGVNYIIHKQYNDVWESDDGLTWTALTTDAPWHGRWDHDVAIASSTFYLVAGMSSATVGYDDIWKSPDGADWTLVATATPLGKRQGHVILQYRGVNWLIGGLDTASNVGYGEAWYSRDGEHWTKVPVDGGWEGREDHQAVVFKDKIVVFTGMGTSWHWTRDVWTAYLPP